MFLVSYRIYLSTIHDKENKRNPQYEDTKHK